MHQTALSNQSKPKPTNDLWGKETRKPNESFDWYVNNDSFDWGQMPKSQTVEESKKVEEGSAPVLGPPQPEKNPEEPMPEPIVIPEPVYKSFPVPVYTPQYYRARRC